MFKIQKQRDKDFIILNLTDIHTENHELSEKSEKLRILKNTVCQLVERIKPDLITISGDLAWSGSYEAYEVVREFFDGFKIPWTLAWGNHDQDRGYEILDKTIEILTKSKYLIYENGPMELGRGNFVVGICEGDKIVSALIMMDTHDRLPYINNEGKECMVWGKLYPQQFDWYREQVCNLTDLGCKDTMIITHQPIYAYIDAFKAALRDGMDIKSVSLEDSYRGECWNEGYKDSFGVNYEGVCCFPEDDGFFDLVTELGSTKTIVAGHDHVNCSCIKYKGVRFTYSLKTGMGAYWRPEMNGGTVFTVSSDGVATIKHEFVDPTPWLNPKEDNK